ncbi:hypothetical protein ONZ45_g5949 [Pleurotus djamor]|nr:hypothetical protein ONZ45_g5949 [Pleurotus djamor]
MNFLTRRSTTEKRYPWTIVLNPPPPSPPLPPIPSLEEPRSTGPSIRPPEPGYPSDEAYYYQQQQPLPHPSMIPRGDLHGMSNPKYASISMHLTDRLRFYQFSATDVDVVRDAIRQSKFDIQSEQPYFSCHEIKLRGTPWVPTNTTEVNNSRLLLCYILANLYNSGWVIRASTNVSRHAADKDNLLFRYQYPAPPLCEWFAISFMWGDRLKLLGAPMDLRLPIAEMLGPLLQKEAKIIVLRLIEVLEMNGVLLYVSVDNNNFVSKDKDAKPLEYADTWLHILPNVFINVQLEIQVTSPECNEGSLIRNEVSLSISFFVG